MSDDVARWGCAGGLAGRRRPALAADQLYVPLLTYRTGAFAGSGIPIADGMHDYLEMLNQRDGGIGGVKIAIEECETGYDAQKGRRVLREHQGQGCAGLQSLLDRHHAPADPQGLGRQDPGPGHGLRPVGRCGRRDLPLDLQPAGHLLGRRLGDPQAHRPTRRAGSTSSRARRSASSISTPATAASRSRCSSSSPRVRLRAGQVPGAGQPDAEPELAVAQRPPRPAGLHGDVGLGGDEPDRGQGGGQDPLSRWTSSSASGGRAARTTRGRPARVPRATRP